MPYILLDIYHIATELAYLGKQFGTFYPNSLVFQLLVVTHAIGKNVSFILVSKLIDCNFCDALGVGGL